MSHIVFDLAILAFLIVFAFCGLRKGFVLSLFSLFSFLIALVGAILLSNLWAEPVAQWLQPKLSPTVTSAVETVLSEDIVNAANSETHFFQLLEDAELPLGLEKYLPDIQKDGVWPHNEGSSETTWIDALSDLLTEKLAHSIAKNGLFLVCLILILIALNLLAHGLDLVAKLPVLHTLNQLGGFAIGLLRGALLLFLCAWLVRWLWPDWIPTETIEQSKLLHFFMTFDPLDHLRKN